MLSVDLVGSRPIWPAQVGRPVDLVGSRRVPSDRLDDQPDDQAVRRGALGHPGPRQALWSEHQMIYLVTLVNCHADDRDPERPIAG
jgi:hypothetical protein